MAKTNIFVTVIFPKDNFDYIFDIVTDLQEQVELGHLVPALPLDRVQQARQDIGHPLAEVSDNRAKFSGLRVQTGAFLDRTEPVFLILIMDRKRGGYYKFKILFSPFIGLARYNKKI